jgi:TetR/AcrR family transcriptional regulator, cholesterol catabolism regulator
MARPPADVGTDARERILRAAERLFAEKGYAATAVHEITTAAGVNRALLYYYFEDKHSLYATLIDEGIAEFQRMLEEALSRPGSYAERLEAVARAHLELAASRSDHTRMIFRCLLDGDEKEFGLRERFAAGIERLVQFFREAVTAGEFREVEPAIAARLMLGPALHFSMAKGAAGECLSREAIAEEMVAQLLHGFLRR